MDSVVLFEWGPSKLYQRYNLWTPNAESAMQKKVENLSGIQLVIISTIYRCHRS